MQYVFQMKKIHIGACILNIPRDTLFSYFTYQYKPDRQGTFNFLRFIYIKKIWAVDHSLEKLTVA